MITSTLIVNAEKPHQRAVPGLIFNNHQEQLIKSRTNRSRTSFTIGELLSSIQPLPRQAVLLGRCNDGLPFLMTLSDPAVGAILIGGDVGCGKTHHLQVMVDSLLRTSATRELQVMVITHHTEEWLGLRENPQHRKFFKAVNAWYDQTAEGAIQSLMDLAEARRENRQADPKVLLILDDLNFVEELSFEAQVALRWLLAYSAQSNIWVIGTINSGLASNYRYWLEAFRTRIIGKVDSKSRMADLTLINGLQMKTLEPGEFRVWAGEDWLTYQIPLLGG